LRRKRETDSGKVGYTDKPGRKHEPLA
jgi:hypothetical protein